MLVDFPTRDAGKEVIQRWILDDILGLDGVRLNTELVFAFVPHNLIVVDSVPGVEKDEVVASLGEIVPLLQVSFREELEGAKVSEHVHQKLWLRNIVGVSVGCVGRIGWGLWGIIGERRWGCQGNSDGSHRC